jgi:cysteine desulfurase
MCRRNLPGNEEIEGVELVYLRPDSNGDFDLNKLEELLKTQKRKPL